jgi:hypothetical protein
MKVFRHIHEWNKNGSNLFFHTFPMLHIGEKSYFDEIAHMLQEMNQVLIEGVAISKNKELGSYIKIARLLGLTSQIDTLKMPTDIVVKNIDMPSVQFKHEVKVLPFKEKLKLFFIELFMKKIPKKYASLLHKQMEVTLGYSEDERIKLIDPENHYAFMHYKKSKLDLLIENKRNEIITKNLDDYILLNTNRSYRMDIAILFGDAHMPYIYKKLKDSGFTWKLERTINVF